MSREDSAKSTAHGEPTNQQSSGDECDFDRRFGGVSRLYGSAAFTQFQQAHICVIGIGGVGSWVVEALARSAVGKLTLIDLDNVAESNVNRQIHALGDEFGKAKVKAMAERVHAINPRCMVTEIENFITPDNLDTMLGPGFDYVIDAIDNARTKAALIAWCKRNQVRLITSGGAGGRIDPTKIQLIDLSKTVQDSLLARVRTLLRREYGFPKDPKKKFGVDCVFSTEPIRRFGNTCDDDEKSSVTGLNCAGYGSATSVTSVFGMVAAAKVLSVLSTKADS